MPATRPGHPAPPLHPVPAVSLGQALRFWLKLGFISFGGPAGQIAIMHRELVEQRRWISERRFLHALNYCMLLPGPEAQQLATYIGWLMHRTWGGLIAGGLFVLPSLFILIGLGWVYVAFGQVPAVAGLFYGIKPAVAAVVLHALWRIGGRTLRHPRQVPALWTIALASFIGLAVLRLPFPLIVLGAALCGMAGARWLPAQFGGAAAAHPPGLAGGSAHSPGLAGGAAHAPAQPDALPPVLIDDHTPTPPHARFSRARLLRVLAVFAALWLATMAALLLFDGGSGTLVQMAGFFTKAAFLTFGGAYAVLPYVWQGAVEHHQWLSGPQMIDALALGEATPGPLIMVVAFVGFLGGWSHEVLGPEARFLGGALAACVVTWFTFLPSFLFILAGGPLVESTHGQLRFTAPLTAITAAVVGVIASLALFFLGHVLLPAGAAGPDLVALSLLAVASVALFRFKLGVITVIAASALAGLALRLAALA